ncbi:MAG: ribosomal protein S18-alanine N-acetyltransferase [Candidatus Promineifilaceae bacterium]|nr:ribosomal protein S18-alanine N-acetyltransferase [Candidatus Promineifilaceae bacterium]
MIAFPPPFAIRSMMLDDVDAVMPIEAVSFPTPWPADGYRHELTQNKRAHYDVLCHVAEGESIVIGYSGYWLVAGEAHISIVAVHPDWRGRGLGELLLLHMLVTAVARGAEAALLEVREGNVVARKLYRKYGFEAVGRRKGYYKDTGEDAILMSADLAAPGYRQQLRRLTTALSRRL